MSKHHFLGTNSKLKASGDDSWFDSLGISEKEHIEKRIRHPDKKTF
jgi:hypothetical protein